MKPYSLAVEFFDTEHDSKEAGRTKSFPKNWNSKAPSDGTVLSIKRLLPKLYFFMHKTFLFLKIVSWNFQHLFKKYFTQLTKFQLIQLIQTIFISIFSIHFLIELKFCEVSQNSVSAFYIEKQKSFIPRKKIILGHSL